MSTVHKNLTGADLHEPKGADTATSGKVYVSNGAGGGVWTTASDIVTNSAFTTGDTKFTLKTAADTGWILGAYGSLGDGSSGATVRANADTSALFTLLWTNCSNALCPVSTGRGASAALDFAAHKTITLPDMWQRAVGVAGSYNGSGQTTRALGVALGFETTTLIAANIPPLTSTNPSQAISVVSTVSDIVRAPNGVVSSNATGGINGQLGANTGTTAQITSIGTASITVTSTGTSGTAINIVQPTVWINIMIKL